MTSQAPPTPPPPSLGVESAAPGLHRNRLRRAVLLPVDDPSLLPRDWLFQGLIGGLIAAIGYGIGGVFVAKMIRRFVLEGRRWWPPAARTSYALKAATVAISVAACVLMVIPPAAGWQRQVSALMGMQGPPARWVIFAPSSSP